MGKKKTNRIIIIIIIIIYCNWVFTRLESLIGENLRINVSSFLECSSKCIDICWL
jgi:hypothetical protein